MNNQIYNFYPNPLYVIGATSNALLSTNFNFFSATISGFSVSVGGNYSIQLSNPSNSGKTLYFYKASFSNSGASVGMAITFMKNGSFSQAGTAVTPINTNFSSTATNSIASVKHGAFTASGGSTIISTLQSTAIYTELVDSIIAMPPNTTLVIEIDNGLLSLQTVSANIFWYEI